MKIRSMVLVLSIVTSLTATAQAQVTAADYGAWRVAERASYQQLDQAAIQAWLGPFSRQEIDAARRILPNVAYWSGNDQQLGSFSRQEIDAARRILPDVAYWSGNDQQLSSFSRQEIDAARRILPNVAYWSGNAEVSQAQRAPETYDWLSGRFIEGGPSGVATAAPQPESIILRGVADPPP